MTSPGPDAEPDDDEVLAGVRSATIELGDSVELEDLPLTEIAHRFGELHRELQGALADLDRA